MTSNLGEDTPLESGVADFIQPTLRVFLSVDLVGSTGFKQSRRKDKFDGPSQSWLKPIIAFYHDFETELAREWSTFSSYKIVDTSNQILWKVIGDELIYIKELTTFEELICTVQVWRRALRKYRSILKVEFGELDVKSTAWLAGFPFQNAEVGLETSSEGKSDVETVEDPELLNFELLKRLHDGDKSILLDFVGPAIDTGFRLCNFCSREKFVVSADLAYVLCCKREWWDLQSKEQTRLNPEWDYGDMTLDLHYDGREPLKGVLEDRAYPIIWLSMVFEEVEKSDNLEDRLRDREYKLNPRQKPANTKHLEDFLSEFLDGGDKFPSIPYIHDPSRTKEETGDPLFNLPQAHEDKVQDLRDYFVNQTSKMKIERKSIESPDEEGPTLKFADENSTIKTDFEAAFANLIESLRKISDLSKDNH